MVNEDFPSVKTRSIYLKALFIVIFIVFAGVCYRGFISIAADVSNKIVDIELKRPRGSITKEIDISIERQKIMTELKYEVDMAVFRKDMEELRAKILRHDLMLEDIYREIIGKDPP